MHKLDDENPTYRDSNPVNLRFEPRLDEWAIEAGQYYILENVF